MLRGLLITGIVALLWSSPALCHRTPPDSREVPAGYREVARLEGVPAEALYSLALTESSYTLPASHPQAGEVHPWPWTINVAGRGYRYPTRDTAWQALQGFLRTTSPKRIDVGIAQVNLGWNGHHFRSTREAFDPYTNLHVAARILRACYDARPGSWIAAAGCYHHPKGGSPAARYQGIVRRKLATLTLETPLPAVSSRREMNLSTPATSLVWTEPEVKP